MKIWIVVPTWRRYHITDVVFYQHQWLIKSLRRIHDINVVVVGDDKNLDIARKYGFHTVVRDNQFLGRKFNDGYEYAFKHGADVVVPCGSDSFIHPSVFLDRKRHNLSNSKVIHYSTRHAMIKEDGKKLGIVEIPKTKEFYNKGALWFYTRGLMKNCNFRPCEDKINKSCDRFTIKSLRKNNKNISFKSTNYNDLQYLAIKNNKVQIWGYELYRDKFIRESNNPEIEITKYYNKEIASKVMGIYK